MSSAQQLKTILLAEYETTSQLLKVLENERESLIYSDIDVINKTTKQKQPLIIKLEQLNRQREALLQAEGFPTDKKGLESYIENQLPQDTAELNRILGLIKNVARVCCDYNQINGGIVNVNRQYLQKALSILRGRDMNVTAYGPGGEYTSQVVRQPLLGRV